MSIFRCSKCGCAENTAVSHYHTREKNSPPLCSECDPSIGKWHGRFPKISAEEYVEKDGFLISKEEAAFDKAQDLALKFLPNVKHIGLEGVAKYFFSCGWSRGRDYVSKGE